MWRKPNKEFIRDVITERWKGFSEFMWWSAFSWDFKSTPHIWQPETGAEKEAAKADLNIRNAARIVEDENNWRLNSGMGRVGLRGVLGRRPEFRHIEETGAYVRKARRGGIN